MTNSCVADDWRAMPPTSFGDDIDQEEYEESIYEYERIDKGMDEGPFWGDEASYSISFCC